MSNGQPQQNTNPEVIETSFGSSERSEVLIRTITIHDLWHIAMCVSENGDKKSCDKILDVWALAHEMQNKLIAIADKK
jgi:hypothetical protein